MSTNIYTYPFPGSNTYTGLVLNQGNDLFPSDTLEPSNTLEVGTPPTLDSPLFPGLSVLYATVEDPLYGVDQDAPPEFLLQVADTRTGRIGFELPYEKFSWSTPLNSAGSMTVTVPVNEVVAYDDPLDERATRNMLREIATGPWRFTFVLSFGGRAIFAGPLVAVKLTGDNQNTVDFGCVELWDIFRRRLLVNPAAGTPTEAAADTTFQATTLENIAKQLIGQATTGTGSELPIDLPTVEVNGGHQRFYYGYDLATIGERLEQLTKVINGPDVRFDPYLVTGLDANYVRWAMSIGTPFLSSPGSFTWEHNVNASIDFDLDSKDMSFTYHTTGSGQDRDKKVGYAADLTLVNTGFPLLESVDSTHASASEQNTLDGWAAGDIEAYATPVETWTINVWADDNPRLGEYRVGDTASIGVKGHLLIPDGFFNRRIVGLSGDSSGKVSLSGDSKPEEITAASDNDVLGATETTEQTVTVAQAGVPAGVWTTLLAWGYTPTNGSIAIPRSTLAAAYQYQSALVGA